MARTLVSRPAAPPAVTHPAVMRPAGFRGRGLERRLLLANLPLAGLAAWGVAAAQPPGSAVEPRALAAPAVVWASCFGLHLLLCACRFDGDLLLLPLLSVLFVVGSAYHMDLAGPASPGVAPGGYTAAALGALAVLAALTVGGRWLRRLSILFEERVWWRIAGDRPYYESVPLHLLLLGTMLVLALLLLAGGVPSSGGALIQVNLPGGIRFTPSELIRLAVAFFLADYLGRNSRNLRSLRQPLGPVWPLNRLHLERRSELLVVLTTVGLYCFFFYAFRDFGPAAVIVVLTLAALYAATGRMLTPMLLGAAIAAAIAIPTWQDLAFHTFRNRAAMWLDPWNTAFVNGDHQARILWAIAAGGWFGMGAGAENLPAALPLARNDAAFAGITAAMGLWTGLAVLGVFAAITWRGMLAARAAPTDRTRLLAFTLTVLIAFQAIWICGAMVRVFPFTGINVPFLSTGLSSMLVSAFALGTVWNISRPVPEARSTGGDPTEATIEVQRGVTRLGRPVTAAFLLPAIGLLVYGCPWLLGDDTLIRKARAVGHRREKAEFQNPYLERFRQRLPRGRVFSADGRLLAVSGPTPAEIQAIRETDPRLADAAEGRGSERLYPLGAAAAQLVGWTTQGKFAALPGSVEASWDALLRGYEPSKLPLKFRLRHNPLVPRPRPQDLQLTIEAGLQQFAAERLAAAVREWGGAGGAAVLYDVHGGGVLAAVTAPSFDPNGLTLERMQQYAAEHPGTQVLTNKALSRRALYFPGSSFKILTAAAGVEEGITGTASCLGGRNGEELVWESGGIRWRREAGRIRDFSRGGHGTLDLAYDMERALIASCNVFFARLATALGPERLRRAMASAELGEVPPVRELAEYLPAAGFGQTVVKTAPLEMAQLAGAAGIAREDLPEAAASRPHWVQAVVSGSRRREPDGILGSPNRRPYRPFTAAAAQAVRRMMIGVVADPSGTAHAAFFTDGAPRLPGITVGGKTGTAEFDRAGGAGRGRHAWFVGFARSDYEIQPRTLAFAVLVEDVRRGASGGAVCAPVARDLLAQVFRPADEAPAVDLERFYAPRPQSTMEQVWEWLRRQLDRR